MSIEISILTLAKLAGAFLATYFLVPLVLVARDFFLWSLIDKFILNRECQAKIREHAMDVEKWNHEVARKQEISFTEEKGVILLLDDEEVSIDEWNRNKELKEHLGKKIENDRWYIQKRSNLVTWLLKHYKQDSENPMSRWAQKAEESASLKYKENAVNKAVQPKPITMR